MSEQSSAFSLTYAALPRCKRGVFEIKMKISGLTVWLWVVCSAMKLAPKPQRLEMAPAESPPHPDLGTANPNPERQLRAVPGNAPQSTPARGASKWQRSATATSCICRLLLGRAAVVGRGFTLPFLTFLVLFPCQRRNALLTLLQLWCCAKKADSKRQRKIDAAKHTH